MRWTTTLGFALQVGMNCWGVRPFSPGAIFFGARALPWRKRAGDGVWIAQQLGQANLAGMITPPQRQCMATNNLATARAARSAELHQQSQRHPA
ncbi:MAG: hypothetical protein H6656_10250 [Ardenticatenaceae bacterium]|nr:hypothetical protein [Ardenticatenaceae bacterium]